MTAPRTLWTDEAGQDLAEYALLLALIAMLIVIAVLAFRGAVENRFLDTASTLNAVPPAQAVNP